MKDYSFGNYICALRTGLGLSQFQLGNLVGVTDKAVSKWENGDAKPRLSSCYRLAEVLGVSINELLSCEQYITIPARKELDKMNKQLWKEAYEGLSRYGENSSAICWSRLAAEEAALCGTDAIQAFAVLGKIRAEAKNNNTTILVGGTIGSSFAAWLMGATEVNPLPPHYMCSSCGKIEFVQGIADGFDLPPKKCSCGQEFRRDGHDIPYEGYVEAERNGTYIEIRTSDSFKPLAIKSLLSFYEGIAEILPVKVHSNQNAWVTERYVVLPTKKAKPVCADDGFWHVDLEEFWGWQENETSFTFLVSEKLNAIDKMQAATGISALNPQEYVTPKMVQALCDKRKRTTSVATKVLSEESHDFDLLLRLDLLSHSASAWTDNGEELFLSGKVMFRELPASREDVFNLISRNLLNNGICDNGLAVYVMEHARKGSFGRQGMTAELEGLLLSLGAPRWYLDCLNKTKYLFPKAHGIAHLLIDVVDEWYRMNFSDIYEKICVEKSAD